jgi:hypothetical protein
MGILLRNRQWRKVIAVVDNNTVAMRKDKGTTNEIHNELKVMFH